MEGLGTFTLLVLGITGAPILLAMGRRLASSLPSSAGQNAVTTCSVDSDCPPGYVCRNGVCVPATQG